MSPVSAHGGAMSWGPGFARRSRPVVLLGLMLRVSCGRRLSLVKSRMTLFPGDVLIAAPARGHAGIIAYASMSVKSGPAPNRTEACGFGDRRAATTRPGQEERRTPASVAGRCPKARSRRPALSPCLLRPEEIRNEPPEALPLPAFPARHVEGNLGRTPGDGSQIVRLLVFHGKADSLALAANRGGPLGFLPRKEPGAAAGRHYDYSRCGHMGQGAVSKSIMSKPPEQRSFR